jgi:hypothetical protein
MDYSVVSKASQTGYQNLTRGVSLSDNEALIDTIQELCGVAGLTPFARNKTLWNADFPTSKSSQADGLAWLELDLVLRSLA